MTDAATPPMLDADVDGLGPLLVSCRRKPIGRAMRHAGFNWPTTYLLTPFSVLIALPFFGVAPVVLHASSQGVPPPVWRHSTYGPLILLVWASTTAAGVWFQYVRPRADRLDLHERGVRWRVFSFLTRSVRFDDLEAVHLGHAESAPIRLAGRLNSHKHGDFVGGAERTSLTFVKHTGDRFRVKAALARFDDADTADFLRRLDELQPHLVVDKRQA